MKVSSDITITDQIQAQLSKAVITLQIVTSTWNLELLLNGDRADFGALEVGKFLDAEELASLGVPHNYPPLLMALLGEVLRVAWLFENL